MAFPFETEEEMATEEVVATPREYEIDYETGELTGEIVEGVDAIKVWIWNSIHSIRYKHLIYSIDYGSELDDLIGQSFTQEYLETEVKDMLEDCLLINENITGIDNLYVKLEDECLDISFTAITLFGEVVTNV